MNTLETYGVDFTDFVPSCGWPTYKNAEGHMIPNMKREVERFRALRERHAQELATLKDVQPEIDGLAKGCTGLLARLQSQDEDGSNLGELMTLGVDKEHDKTCAVVWDGLCGWLAEAEEPILQIAFLYGRACRRAREAVAFCDRYIKEYETAIAFWSRTLEIERAHYVFEKAPLKYKTKACRELVKALADYVGQCQMMLQWVETCIERDVLKETPMRADIEWFLNEAVENLAYYRQIKADIALAGVEEALRHSSRKVVPDGERQRRLTKDEMKNLAKKCPLYAPGDPPAGN